MKRYQTKGATRVAMIEAALAESGCKTLKLPRTDEAPFLFEILSPSGEFMTIVCYAFTANKYSQGGRPKDEHRFQVKYGSDFARSHSLYIDDSRSKITLMFG